MNRRDFILKSAIGFTSLTTGIPLLSRPSSDFTKLTILHTNDMHSRIDPFPEGDGKYAGKGGMSKRATMIQAIREESEHTLLLDSGDIFQGTPYFNFYGGELELKLMTQMGYDAATMGNHDFDAGLDGFEKQLKHANFPFVTSNYDLSDTILHGSTEKFIIKEVGPLRVGIIGLGIELEGLVPKNLYKETRYLEPITASDQLAKQLKRKHDVDLVICLSHLGYQYFSQKVDDLKLAQNTKYIDIILGGHTHTFLRKPSILQNLNKKPVLINQVGWGGIALGKIDLFFSKNKSRGQFSSSNLIIN